MIGGESLRPSSRFLLVLVGSGFVLAAVAWGIVRWANAPVPPGGPYDPEAYHQRAAWENAGIAMAGFGALLTAGAMTFLGLTGHELNPQARRGALVGGAILLLALAFLFMRPIPSLIFG